LRSKSAITKSQLISSPATFYTGTLVPVFLTFSCVCVTIYTMPFCYSPWTNVDISPQGEILPCCKYQPNAADPVFNIQTHSLAEYSNSAFLQQIKQEFKQHTWPAGCVRCQIEEQNNIKSKRELDLDRWHQYYAHYELDSNQWLTASIAFGNTCNLKCITCGSYSSSRWREEYLDVYNKNFQHVKFYRDDFVEKFVARAPGVIHLDIPGGEPFLSGVPEQKKLLAYYIQSQQAENISLHYTTNTTVFPDQEWWELWSHFREIDMQLSIDGIGARYEYIRYPAVWNHTEHNVHNYLQKQTPNFRLSVSHTVSAYNIFYLDEFFDWCYNIGLPRPWLGRVYDPAHMSPEVWPKLAKDFIVNHLMTSEYDDVKNWAQLISQTNDQDQFAEFCQRLQQHDQYRGLNFRDTFPEMAQYII
jgi:MoaA/NifB/PqqE/SkfB family radical SAM enzyme